MTEPLTPFALLGISEAASIEDALAAFEDRARALLTGVPSSESNGLPSTLQSWSTLTGALETVVSGIASEAARDSATHQDQTPSPTLEHGERGAFQGIVDWPAPPDEAEAREALRQWARSKRLVPNELFDGPLVIEQASAAKLAVTRLIEHRSEGHVTVPSNAGRPTSTYSLSIEGVELPPPVGFEPTSWQFILEGSEQASDCPSCQSGQVRCGWCQGAGRTPCSPTQNCSSCFGKGQTYNGERCSSCAGRGTVQCTKCGGSGWKMCLPCLGQGYTKCGKCEGTGVLVSYVLGSIERAPETDEVLLPPPQEVKPKDDEWESFGPFQGVVAPDGLPEEAREQVAAKLEQKPEGELLRKLDVKVLPVFRVSHEWEEATRNAFLIGKSQRVEAPGARRASRRVRRLILAGAVIALATGIAIGALVYLMTSTGSSSADSAKTPGATTSEAAGSPPGSTSPSGAGGETTATGETASGVPAEREMEFERSWFSDASGAAAFQRLMKVRPEDVALAREVRKGRRLGVVSAKIVNPEPFVQVTSSDVDEEVHAVSVMFIVHPSESSALAGVFPPRLRFDIHPRLGDRAGCVHDTFPEELWDCRIALGRIGMMISAETREQALDVARASTSFASRALHRTLDALALTPLSEIDVPAGFRATKISEGFANTVGPVVTVTLHGPAERQLLNFYVIGNAKFAHSTFFAGRTDDGGPKPRGGEEAICSQERVDGTSCQVREGGTVVSADIVGDGDHRDEAVALAEAGLALLEQVAR